MKKILATLGPVLGKSFADDTSEETLADSVKSALGAKDAEILVLKEKNATLEPLAADGKGYRDGLVADFVRMKAALGEADSDATKQEGVTTFAAAMPVAMLKSECAHLQVRMEKAFPAGQITGSDPNANRDAKSASDNPLIVVD